MNFDIATLSKNPLLLTSALLFACSAGLLLTTVGLLLNAVVYNPEPRIFEPSGSTSLSRVDAGQIGERNFFGQASSEGSITDSLELPETELALVLRGAFAEKDQQQAGAIIEDENTKIANHYRVGEELPGDATLKAVYANRVVLTRNGLLETLYFQDLAGKSGIGSTKLSNAAGTSISSSSIQTSDEARKRRDAVRARIKQLRNR